MLQIHSTLSRSAVLSIQFSSQKSSGKANGRTNRRTAANAMNPRYEAVQTRVVISGWCANQIALVGTKLKHLKPYPQTVLALTGLRQHTEQNRLFISASSSCSRILDCPLLVCLFLNAFSWFQLDPTHTDHKTIHRACQIRIRNFCLIGCLSVGVPYLSDPRSDWIRCHSKRWPSDD